MQPRRRTGLQTVPGTLIVLLSMCAPERALADDDYRTALMLAMTAKEKAIDSHLKEDWNEARLRIQQVERIRVTAETKYEMALVEAGLGLEDLALESYELALDLGLSGIAAEKARSALNDRRPQMAQLDVHGAAGSRVLVRGTERGTLPREKPLYVLPGECDIGVITPSGRILKRSFAVVAGRVTMVRLEEDRGHDASSSTLSDEAQLSDHSQRRNSRAATAARIAAEGIHNDATPPPLDSGHRNSWLLIGVGTTIGVIASTYIPISTSKVKSGRQALSAACGVPMDGPDTCKNSKVGQQQDAQSASDSIATWKAVRTGAWLGLAGGIAAVGAGLTLWLTSPTVVRRKVSTPQISIGPQRVDISIEGNF